MFIRHFASMKLGVSLKLSVGDINEAWTCDSLKEPHIIKFFSCQMRPLHGSSSAIFYRIISSFLQSQVQKSLSEVSFHCLLKPSLTVFHLHPHHQKVLQAILADVQTISHGPSSLLHSRTKIRQPLFLILLTLDYSSLFMWNLSFAEFAPYMVRLWQTLVFACSICSNIL